MDVSIIIVNYNTYQLVCNCISSIIKNTLDIQYEIIVVDNASTDISRDYFSKDSRIKYIYNEYNLGFGLANNEGIKIANGRNIFFLNPDTILLNNAIKILSDFLDANPKVGSCGGNLYDEVLNPAYSYSMMIPSFLWELNLLLDGTIEKIRWGKSSNFNYSNKIKKVGYISGADMMVRRSTLNQIGLFSDKIFLYYEDTELSFRLKKAGYDIISLPFAKIQHLEGKSMGGKAFNKQRIEFIETSLSVFYSIHTSGFKRILLNYMRLLRLEIKYRFLYKKKFGLELYYNCKLIIKNCINK